MDKHKFKMKVISVDVGSGSVRAAITEFDQGHVGSLLASCTKEILTESPNPDWYEQSSGDIWDAVVECIKACTSKAGGDVSGIAFTATCSLVIVEAG